jgi:hypothetical protein
MFIHTGILIVGYFFAVIYDVIIRARCGCTVDVAKIVGSSISVEYSKFVEAVSPSP